MAGTKILIICGAGYVSGKEIMALELAQALSDEGQCVSVVRSFWSDGEFSNRLEKAGLASHVLPIGFISASLTKANLAMTAEQVLRWPGLLWNYFRLLRRLKPERVIHTNWHHLLLLLPFCHPGRDIYWVHEVIPDLPQYRTVFRWFERKVQCFVVVSRATAGSLRRLGISDSKICVIHNGLQDPSQSPSGGFVTGGRVRIGIVGQVGSWKGHDDLAEAFASVFECHPEVELHIFGEGGLVYQNALVDKLAKLGVAAATHWHAFIADRTRIYEGLDVCAVPSRSNDPLPTVAIEAGFFSLPVIATRRGGLPEIVDDGKTGILVNAEQPAELAEALCRLIEDPELRRTMGHNARLRAVEYFGRKRFLADFSRLLNLNEEMTA